MYNCYPLVIFQDEEHNNPPSLEQVIDGMLNHFEIPIKIISDPQDPVFIDITKSIPKNITPLHVIIVIKYFKTFEA